MRMAIVVDAGQFGRVAVRGQRFYVGMAACCVAVAVLGFAPTYWIPMFRGMLDVPPIAHLHALLFYGWTLLFLQQTRLVAAGRMTRHREWGVLGVALATSMVFVGVGTAVHSLKRLDAEGFGAAATAFTVVPVTAAALFAVLFAIAMLNVKKPEIHKRLLLVATVSLLQAAVGRWFTLLPAPAGAVGPPPAAVTLLPGLIADLLIVAAMVHDRRTRGRVHRTYWIAGAAVLMVQVLRVPISTTASWATVANGLVALFP
jgi:hypothetical protein